MYVDAAKTAMTKSAFVTMDGDTVSVPLVEASSKCLETRARGILNLCALN